MGFGEFCLFGIARRADDRRAKLLKPLAGKQTNPARRRMPQNNLPGAHRIQTANKIFHRHSLQQHRCRLFKRYIIRQRYQPVGGGNLITGITAQPCGAKADPVAGLDRADIIGGLFHNTGAFQTQHRRQRQRIQTGAMININEVNPGGGDFDKRLAFGERRQGYRIRPQFVRPAGLVNPYCCCFHLSMIQYPPAEYNTRNPMPQADKKTILITGCSSGIGLHCARALLETSRWRVFAAARKVEDADKLRAEGFDSLVLDLADEASVRAAAAEVLAKTDGKLDALFNNGAYAIPGAVEDISRDALQTQFETNVFGWHQLTNAVIPAMRKRGGGRIIQNSSVLGYVALKYRGAYNASKYAIEGLTDTMRLELAGSGIRLILIEPGPVRSKFRDNATAQYHKWIKPEASPHRDTYKRMEQAWQEGREMVFTLPPDAVWRALRHALESRSPRLRYRITIPAKLFWYLKRVLPTSVLDRLLRLAG